MKGAVSAEVSIRPITVDDTPGFRTCLDVVAREGGFLRMLEAPPPDQVRDFVATGRERGVVQLVAVASDQIVGWCDVSPMRWEGFRHSGVLGTGLLPGYRGRGIGGRLLEATLAEAADRGITRVELEVFASNRPAIRFYEKFGFEHEGRKRGARLLDGVSDDLVCMARVRGSPETSEDR